MERPFGYCAAEYQAYRPGYPDTLFDFLIAECNLEPNQTILDVGAGTGKGSAYLAAWGGRVIAVDQDQKMLRAGPEDWSARVCGRADQVPLAASMAHLVLCAQSFHWFDTEVTLKELQRLLKPSGHLTLFWNTPSEHSPAQQAYDRLATKYNPEYSHGYRKTDWASILEATGLFRSIAEKSFDHSEPMSIERWQGLARTSSKVRSVGEPKLTEFQEELGQLLEQVEKLEIDYTTELWLATPISQR